MTRRPYLIARPYVWKDQGQNETPGVGIFRGESLKAHLTPDEARNFSDLLHDLADKTEQENRP